MSGPKIAAKSVARPKRASKRPKNSSEAHKKAARQRMKALYDALSPAERLIRNWRRIARPPFPREDSARSRKHRATALARAYCDWSNVEEVVRMYIAAAVMSELVGQAYVLAHTVPLNHPLVCGLHTHTNIRVVTHTLNRLEGNWIWPDMWPPDATTMELLEQLAEQQEDRFEAAYDDEHSGFAAPEWRARAGSR